MLVNDSERYNTTCCFIMISNKLILPFAGIIMSLSLLITACNKDTTDTPYYVEPTSVAVNGFSLKPDTKVLSGLDSVFFSIDLERGLIFNADSLPKGTNIKALIPIISLPASVTKATIVMDGGEHRTGEVDYLKSQSDSIDFTGRVMLELTSSEGNSRAYQLKVNVHTMEPDSLWWGNTAIAKLPSRLGDPRQQRTIQKGDGSVAALIAEKDGTYTFSCCDDPFTGDWRKNQVVLPFVPQIRTLAYCADSFYILSEQGRLCFSSDGEEWNVSDATWDNIIGAYGDTLLGISSGNSDRRQFVSLPAAEASADVPADFPVTGYTNFLTISSKWWNEPMGMMYGGSTADGKISSDVWAFDGTSWAKISNGGLPALTGAVILPYFTYRRTDKSWVFTEYSVLMMLGGRDSDGVLNRSMYISFDNGVFWNKASDMMQMPEYIPGMYDMDAVTASTRMTGNFEPSGWTPTETPELPSWFKVDYATNGYDVEWMCPYIYLYGGRDSQDKLYDTVWRGVIRRLTFMPML